MEIKDIVFSYDKREPKVLDHVSFAIERKKITTVLGANGSGKSTLFQLMTKNLVPNRGKILYNGKNIQGIGYKEFAKKAAIVHQGNTYQSDITVQKLVSYGRTPYLSMLGTMRKEDHEIVEWAMEEMGVQNYREQSVMDLSGGQRQRVRIAMALAQKTDFLFLDEPTTYLDIRYQLELLERIKELNEKLGITVVMVLHDINHAIYYSDQIIGLKDGHVEVVGNPEEVITSDSIERLYGIRLDVMRYEGKKIVLNV